MLHMPVRPNRMDKLPVLRSGIVVPLMHVIQAIALYINKL